MVAYNRSHGIAGKFNLSLPGPDVVERNKALPLEVKQPVTSGPSTTSLTRDLVDLPGSSLPSETQAEPVDSKVITPINNRPVTAETTQVSNLSILVVEVHPDLFLDSHESLF